MSAPVERVVLGRYRLGPVLGRGGAATVYRGTDLTTGEVVAVKEIPVGLEMARRAGAEVRAACRLEHPGIVQLMDFGEDTHACYLVSELIDGPSLSARLRDGSLDDRQAVAVIADVLEGLAHAHERGVTHRDVKPANILVDRSGRGTLADFGIARIAGEAGLTQTGGLVGTVSYMSPEQARGGEAGSWSDVYSACLVLYECLTGANPLVGTNQADTLRRAGDGRVPPLASARPDLPRDLCGAIDAGLSVDPRRRPHPGDLAVAIRRAGTGARLPLRTPHRAATLTRGSCAAAASVVAAVTLHRFTDLDPLVIAGLSAALALAFASAPFVTTLLAWVAAMTVLTIAAPAAGVLLGAAGVVLIAPYRGRGHLLAVPLLAPLAATLGVAPVIALAAGLVRGWAQRIWVAVSAGAAALTWQLVAGASPALDGGRLNGAWPDLDGRKDPVHALTAITDAAAARPSVIVAAGVIALGAMFVPMLLRLRSGVPRALGVATWIAGLIVVVAMTGGSVENALGALIPGGILVAAGAAIPWQRLRRGGMRREAVTLRATPMERQSAA